MVIVVCLHLHLQFQTLEHCIVSIHLLTEQPVGRRAEMKQWWRRRKWQQQQSSGGAFGASGERERRQTRERRALTHYLKPLHKSKWITWRRHDAGISHTHAYTNMSVHKHICSLSVTRICVWVQNKAGWLLFTGCGNRFASMLSLSREGERNTERDVRQGGWPSVENLRSKISTHTDVTVVQVRLLHARCTNAEQLHNPKRNCWRRESPSDRGTEKGWCHL